MVSVPITSMDALNPDNVSRELLPRRRVGNTFIPPCRCLTEGGRAVVEESSRGWAGARASQEDVVDARLLPASSVESPCRLLWRNSSPPASLLRRGLSSLWRALRRALFRPMSGRVSGGASCCCLMPPLLFSILITRVCDTRTEDEAVGQFVMSSLVHLVPATRYESVRPCVCVFSPSLIYLRLKFSA